MAQRRSTKIISLVKWIRTSGLLIKNSFSVSAALNAAIGSDAGGDGKRLPITDAVQGYLAHKKVPTPQEHRRTLCKGLL